VRLVLYSADWDYHSGKYFFSSDVADWNAQGRPTLEVVWGDPTATPSSTTTATATPTATGAGSTPTTTPTATPASPVAGTPSVTPGHRILLRWCTEMAAAGGEATLIPRSSASIRRHIAVCDAHEQGAGEPIPFPSHRERECACRPVPSTWCLAPSSIWSLDHLRLVVADRVAAMVEPTKGIMVCDLFYSFGDGRVQCPLGASSGRSQRLLDLGVGKFDRREVR